MVKSDTSDATQLADAMRGQGERLIDHLYRRVLEAFGVLFVGVLVVVTLSRLFVAYLRRRAERANREARLAARAAR